LLTERNVDGILFARPSTEKDDRHIASLIRQGMPLVTTAYFVPGEQMTVVDVDNIDGGHRATMCLIDAGHRHIAMIAGPDWKSANERSQGYHLALDQANLPYDDALVRAGDWSYHSGYQAMKSLLAQAPHLTALFAHNDQMAIGAIRAVLESGRLIPDDVAVVGYDDIPAASYSYPPLTTIHQPMQEVGHIATQLLIETINNPGMEPKEVLLETELIRRASCGSAHDVASQNFGRT
jgi:DNA-binding LacI/PurR family transcriptional regulator